MTMREKEIFVAVVEEGRVGEAARRLGLAQPTVSSIISKWEQLSKRPLFERRQRRLILTVTGAAVYRICRQSLSLEGRMVRLMQEEQESEPIRIGASQTVCSPWFCQLVRRAETRLGKADVHVLVDNSHTVEEKIIRGELDFGFIERPPQSDLIMSKVVLEDELVVVCGPEMDLGPVEAFSIRDIDGRDFIHREHGSGTRRLVRQLAASAGIRLNEKWTCHSNEAVLHAVAANLGISILSKSLLAGRDDIRSYPIDPAMSKRLFFYVAQRDRRFTDQQNLLAEELIRGFTER